MASTFKTPGVYIQEIRKFPPSVAQVETAIPAFIGYTEKAKEKQAGDLNMKPWRISSMAEYELYFGGPEKETGITVTIEETRDVVVGPDGNNVQDPGGNDVVIVTNQTVNAAFTGDRSTHIMFYALQFYFANGGGPCYIISVGGYVDAGGAANPVVLGDDDSGLLGGLRALEKEDEPTLIVFPEAQALDPAAGDQKALYDQALSQCAKLQDRFSVMDMLPHDNGKRIVDLASDFRNDGVSSDNLKYGAAYAPNLETIFDYFVGEGDEVSTVAVAMVYDGTAPPPANPPTDMVLLRGVDNALYNRALVAINAIPCILPPSSGMVGLYAAVDSSRGVWKAPANVSVKSVVKPILKISSEDQEGLNVDVVGGKSINVIRTFQGKGNLVWGARTLAGNDNEWRYVPVRRFFNMAEESIKKATEAFVFEPNDRNTWVLVQGMIENFLTLQWRAGALAGSTPEEAFFVKVGLPETMTALDILEGRMNVEIGMAVVRPAEFIILKFSHKMQES